MFLDVIAFLNEHKIEYATSGKNIGRGWLGIKHCPFCGDKNYHLGINKRNANVFCFKCQTKGWFYDFVMEVFKVDRKGAKKVCHPFMNFFKDGFEKEMLEKVTKVKVPEEFTTSFPKAHIKYLKKRHFGQEVIQRFSLMACMFLTKYRYRVIIPVFQDDRLVTFTARAIDKEQEPRYLHNPNENSVVHIKGTIYNLDLATKHTIICEGPTDVWRMGTSSVATFGTQYTNRQLRMLLKKGVEEVTILSDPDKGGLRMGETLESVLSFIGIKTNKYVLRDRDPADLTDDEAYDLRREILGKIR